MRQYLALILASFLTLGTETLRAQWMVPARQTSVNTNDLQWVPTSKTNVQLVIDWLDDNAGITYTNDFNFLPDITTTVYGIWPYMTNVDNALSRKWTNNHVRLPSITTNLFGIHSYITNIDNILVADSNAIALLNTNKLSADTWNQLYTNDFNVLPDVTTNIAGLWPYMTNVDARLASSSGIDAQPYASFVYATGETNTVSGAQSLDTAWTALSTNHGTAYRRIVVSNGVSQVITASDNYWVIPSNGLYQMYHTIGFWQYNTGAVDTWVTANGHTSSAVSNGASRSLANVGQIIPGVPAGLGLFYKVSGASLFNWSVGTTVRVEAATSATFSYNTAKVSYVSIEFRRVGAP